MMHKNCFPNTVLNCIFLIVTKRGVKLSLKEKGKLIEESMRPGFNRKEIVARYGININTITNILKRKDEILQTLESGKLKVQSRVRLSLQEKAKLIIGKSISYFKISPLEGYLLKVNCSYVSQIKAISNF